MDETHVTTDRAQMQNCELARYVFPRGGGTGLVGGAAPTRDGIILSPERMDGIEIDKESMMAIADAGATLQTLASSASEADLFFPPKERHNGLQRSELQTDIAMAVGVEKMTEVDILTSIELIGRAGYFSYSCSNAQTQPSSYIETEEPKALRENWGHCFSSCHCICISL